MKLFKVLIALLFVIAVLPVHYAEIFNRFREYVFRRNHNTRLLSGNHVLT